MMRNGHPITCLCDHCRVLTIIAQMFAAAGEERQRMADRIVDSYASSVVKSYREVTDRTT